MSSSIKSDSSSTTMAAATSRKKKGQELTKKKPMKKSVRQQKKHRAAKQREYEQKRPRGDYRPRIRLAPGSYVILPIVKAEPVVKKEPDISAGNQPLEKPVIIKKEPAELQAKQSMDNTSSNGRALRTEWVFVLSLLRVFFFIGPVSGPSSVLYLEDIEEHPYVVQLLKQFL